MSTAASTPATSDTKEHKAKEKFTFQDNKMEETHIRLRKKI